MGNNELCCVFSGLNKQITSQPLIWSREHECAKGLDSVECKVAVERFGLIDQLIIYIFTQGIIALKL